MVYDSPLDSEHLTSLDSEPLLRKYIVWHAWKRKAKKGTSKGERWIKLREEREEERYIGKQRNYEGVGEMYSGKRCYDRKEKG